MIASVCVPTVTILSDRWKKLQPSTRCVFLAMLSKKEPENKVVEWANEELATATAVSLNTTTRAISDLCESGFIEVKIKGGRWQSGTVYQINQDYIDVVLVTPLLTTVLSELPIGHGQIYFIGNANQGVVKIGFSLNNVIKRMDALQTGYPYKLSILKTIKRTTVEGELLIHKQFQQYRLNGEWFSIKEELAEYLGV